MKKVLYIFLIALACACAPQSIYKGSNDNMKYAYELVLTDSQLDSLCNAENIPSNLSKWHNFTLRYKYTNKILTSYMFISKNDTMEIVYILKKDSLNFLKKRITY